MKKRCCCFTHPAFSKILLPSLLCIPLFFSCKKQPNPDRHDQLTIWIDSLDRESRKMEIKKSVHILDSLKATLGNLSVKEQMSYYRFKKVLSHRDTSLTSDALLYTDSLLALFSSTPIREQFPLEYSKALLLKGDDLMKEKAYYQAFRHYYMGKSFLTEVGEICECARYSSRIANISFREANYSQAIAYWQQEYRELAPCKKSNNFQLEFIEKQGSLRNIGTAYLFQNKPKIALQYFQQAEDFINQHASEFPREQNFIRYSRIVILRYQAEAHAMAGDFKTAESLLKRCLHHHREIDWSLDVELESRVILTKIYIDTKQFTKAREQLDSLEAQPRQAGNAVGLTSYQNLRAAILFGQGQYQEAAQLFQASIENDHLNQLQKNAESKTDVGQLLQQIQREHEQALATEENARAQLVLTFSILISMTLIVIVYLIWRNSKKSMGNLHAVTTLNKTISQSNIVLQDTINALEQVEIENDAVLKIVAHDLRTPINSIIAATQLVFYDESPTAEQQEIIKGIQRSGQMANALISQILQSGPTRNVITKSDVALEALVQSCIDMLHHKASEKQQMVDYQFECVTAPVDREKIWRVFCNLLSNAIKFSPTGAIIWVRLQRHDSKVLLSVKDNGIGIPEDLHKQIFRPFNDAKRSGTEGEQSFGLGLSICKQIVEAHGGRIWFASADGAGTTFFVELPLM
jgi:signal transduction histidine kinase